MRVELVLGGDDVDVLQDGEHDQPGDRRPGALDVRPQARCGLVPRAVTARSLADVEGVSRQQYTPMTTNDISVPR